MAEAFSVRNGFSFERTSRVLVGSCAKANDVAVTDTVVASEITRLRMKERDNKTIFYLRTLSAIACTDGSATQPCVSSISLLKGRPTKHPAAQSQFRDGLEHGGRTPGSQLKTNLQF